jgi:hypothetical protein
MTIEEELRIEYKRLARNMNSLRRGWKEHVGRDLAACLRNWAQLANEVDVLAARKGWRLSFMHQPKTRAARKMFNAGGISLPLTSSVKTSAMEMRGS